MSLNKPLQIIHKYTSN